MKKNVIKLLDKYDVETIEKSLVQIFLDENSLKSNNLFLNDYLSSFDMIDQKDIDNIILKGGQPLTFEKFERYFELLFPSKDKKLGGIFYTPSYIAEFILDEVLTDNPDFKVLDPSCGAGIFNLVSLNKIKEKFPNKTYVNIIENNIYACDIEPISTNRTKIILILAALLKGENPTEIKFNVITKDSLQKTLKWEDEFPEVFENGGFDAVVGNPPYIRIQNLEDDYKKYLQSNWASAKSGNIDIYYPFIELGLNLLNENGKLGFITPNSHFNTAAGKNLRKILKSKKSMYKIVNFDYVRVFKDVNVYSCVSIFTKKPNHEIKFFKMTEEVTSIDLTEEDYKIVHYDTLDSEKKWVFLSDEEIDKIETIENIGIKLKDLCEINCGIATLADKIYLLTDYKVTVDGKTFNIEPEICKPIIKASTLHNEEEIAKNDLKIIWVYNDEGQILPENTIATKYPNAYAYLKYVKPKLDERDKGKPNEVAWYAFGRTQAIESSFGKKLLTSTMNEKPNFVYCSDENSTFISGYQVKTKKMDLEILKKILNSSIMADYIELISKSYQGGWKSYAKSFIQNFGIPLLTKDELEYLKNENNYDKINEFLENIYFNRKKEVQSVLM